MDDEAPSEPERRGSMTQEEERERRASIQAIMRDTTLTPVERRKSIQSLMDGRRRSSTFRDSYGANGSMSSAAEQVAGDFGSFSDDDDDGVIPEDGVAPSSDHRRMSLTGSLRSSFRSSFRNGSRRSSLRGSFNAGFQSMGFDEEGGQKMDPLALSRKLEKSRPPCGHYQRNCSIVSPCCGLVFGCRICHDDAPELPPPFLLKRASSTGGNGDAMEEDSKMPANGMNGNGAPAAASMPAFMHRSASLPVNFEEEETHHNIDRFLIAEIICRECYTRQSSKTNTCINCRVEFGSYHCNICNLWMSDTEEPYHCHECGFCRVGGRENFKHCADCGMCIDAQLFDDHNCKSGKYMSNCPVCQEDLFSSRMASHEMPCGHAIHWRECIRVAIFTCCESCTLTSVYVTFYVTYHTTKTASKN
jgi:hypothetical protein